MAHFFGELVGTNVAYLGASVGVLEIIGFWGHFGHSDSWQECARMCKNVQDQRFLGRFALIKY